MYRLFILILVSLLSACGSEESVNTKQPEKDINADKLLAEEKEKCKNLDSIKNQEELKKAKARCASLGLRKKVYEKSPEVEW